jgi:hypothetical protein
MAKSGYNESAISFGEAKVGSMEAYNFSAGASITTVHAEKEGKGTSVASAKTMTGQVSIQHCHEHNVKVRGRWVR